MTASCYAPHPLTIPDPSTLIGVMQAPRPAAHADSATPSQREAIVPDASYGSGPAAGHLRRFHGRRAESVGRGRHRASGDFWLLRSQEQGFGGCAVWSRSQSCSEVHPVPRSSASGVPIPTFGCVAVLQWHKGDATCIAMMMMIALQQVVSGCSK